MKIKNMKWPITVHAETHDMKRVVKMEKTLEGYASNDLHKDVLLRAVKTHPRPSIWIGVEIVGVTPLGQTIRGIYEYDNDGKEIIEKI